MTSASRLLVFAKAEQNLERVMVSPPEAPVYDVFISYRTRRSPDGEIAAGLQKALETYRVPRPYGDRLGEPSAQRRSRHRLKVFRDSSDLSAAPNLWDAIRYALERSRWLVVVCSPAACHSVWVQKEISTFLEHQGRERILTVLVEGEPHTAIPEVLRADSEPLAADLRASDAASALRLLHGWRTPKDKQRRYDILAPVLGLRSRDELVRRDRIRTRRRWVSAGLASLLAVVSIGWVWHRVDEAARARIAEVTLKAERLHQADKEKLAESARLTQTAQSESARESERRKQSDKRAQQESASRMSSVARSFRFADPFTAAAEVYRATQVGLTEENRALLAEIHNVLLKRRAVAFLERSVETPEGISFISRMTSGLRYSRLSPDGARVLVVGERQTGSGDRYSPEIPGDATILDNATLVVTKLESCRTQNSLLEFAGFVDEGKVAVARGFELGLYGLDGSCLADFYLLHTKTPISACGGVFRGGYLLAGNATGCVWVVRIGGGRMINPSPALSAVRNCDDRKNPNPLVNVLVNSTGTHGVTLFWNGRADLVTPGEKPMRKPIRKQGVRAVAFARGDTFAETFVASYDDPREGVRKLSRWQVEGNRMLEAGDFDLTGIDAPIDHLGYPADGTLLIGLDAACGLHFWDQATRRMLFSRRIPESACKHAGLDR